MLQKPTNSSEATSVTKPSKTWKRETAWAFILLLAYIIYEGNIGILEVVIWPFMLFIAAAFGVDWAAKQTEMFGWKKENDTKS